MNIKNENKELKALLKRAYKYLSRPARFRFKVEKLREEINIMLKEKQ